VSTIRKLAIGFGAGRVAFAAALAAAPRATTRRWLGAAAETPGGRVGIRGLAWRDGVTSTGVIVAAARGSAIRPWLAACVAGDCADIAATLRERERLPRGSGPGTVALAGAAAAAGIVLAAAADE
jgi:hypothetical protein